MSGLTLWLGWASKRAGDPVVDVMGDGDEGRGTLRGEGTTPPFIDLAPPLCCVRSDTADPRRGGDARV